jgi:indolepyruvate ferredoxin oxidoreductase beta subunit
MLKPKNIILAGVGGQGIILASNILAECLLEKGFDVKKSETHGLAQRGGAVVSFIRFGQKVHSPMVGLAEADYLVAFEKLEAGRNLPFALTGTTILLNDFKIPPLLVAIGVEKYPENIEEILSKVCKTILVPATELAEEAGSAKTINLVMLGVLSRLLPVNENIWEKVISEYFKDSEKIKINLAAFELGRKF